MFVGSSFLLTTLLLHYQFQNESNIALLILGQPNFCYSLVAHGWQVTLYLFL